MMVGQFCADDDDIKRSGLFFFAILNLKSTDIYREYEFRCNYDECNDENIMKNVTDIFNKEYNIELVIQRLLYKNESEGDKTTISTSKPPTSTSSQQKTNSVNSTSVASSVKSTSTTTSVESTSTTSSVTLTSTANPTISSTVATTEGNNGFKIQSTNLMVYVTLITFMLHRIFLI
jgi:cobalamin biosynthesis Mg chelatase CobN